MMIVPFQFGNRGAFWVMCCTNRSANHVQLNPKENQVAYSVLGCWAWKYGATWCPCSARRCRHFVLENATHSIFCGVDIIIWQYFYLLCLIPKHSNLLCAPPPGCSLGLVWNHGNPRPILTNAKVLKMFDAIVDYDVQVLHPCWVYPHLICLIWVPNFTIILEVRL